MALNRPFARMCKRIILCSREDDTLHRLWWGLHIIATRNLLVEIRNIYIVIFICIYIGIFSPEYTIGLLLLSNRGFRLSDTSCQKEKCKREQNDSIEIFEHLLYL